MENEEKKSSLEENHLLPDANKETIFSDISTDMTGYDKNLKRARTWLYIIAGLQLVTGIYEYFKYSDYGTNYQILVLGIDAGIGLIFLGLSLWSYKKPVMAFVVALVFYLLVQAILIYDNPSNIFSGIILKILIIVTLIRAIGDARESVALQTSLGEQD